MLNVRLSDRPAESGGLTTTAGVLALPVVPAGNDSAPAGDTTTDSPGAALAPGVDIDPELAAEIDAYLEDITHAGRGGQIVTLPRPTRTPRRVLLVGVGADDEPGWRAAGAALARAAKAEDDLVVAMPEAAGADSEARVRGVAEGLWLASYQFRLTTPRTPPAIDRHARRPEPVTDTLLDEGLHRVTLCVPDADALAGTLEDAHTVATATYLARDLTNMPSEEKTPAWFAAQIQAIAAGNENLSVRVVEGEQLAAEGFGGIVAVGSGSDRGPRLVELSWAPPTASCHVVLVGKGITFDSGGICIKPVAGMKLMRKDMGGAAAVMSATLGAAEMGLPVRVTALAPLAENSVSGTSFRPGDIVHHYGGGTSEVLNTDAEGRLVLADALAYAATTLAPDYLIDLATLTGANAVALGKRIGALYSENDDLIETLTEAATSAGERVWRMPLHDDYLRDIRSELADVANSSNSGAGSITAALFLREFTGVARDRWAHIDMSAPSWADSADGELTKGATGWGVRTLLRWLEALPAEAA